MHACGGVRWRRLGGGRYLRQPCRGAFGLGLLPSAVRSGSTAQSSENHGGRATGNQRRKPELSSPALFCVGGGCFQACPQPYAPATGLVLQHAGGFRSGRRNEGPGSVEPTVLAATLPRHAGIASVADRCDVGVATALISPAHVHAYASAKHEAGLRSAIPAAGRRRAPRQPHAKPPTRGSGAPWPARPAGPARAVRRCRHGLT